MDLDSRIYSKLNQVSYGDINFEKYRRIVDTIWPLTKIRNHEIPEMWCSHICDPFRKILEESYSRGIFSKNGYITMCKKFYEGDKVGVLSTDYIYCSIYDSLVFIPRSNYSARLYHDNHLKRCISGNTILNEHARRNEILKFIDIGEFQI